MITINDLGFLAAKAGLSLCGISELNDYFKENINLKAWQDKGFAGELDYMMRDSELFTNLENFLDGAKTVMSLACYYNPIKKQDCPKGYGRVARYALGRDYHRVLKKRISKFIEIIKLELGVSFNSRSFTDAVPILERAIAKRASLGFIGKNTMLINPKYGSFSFLAEILCDLEIKAPKLKLREGLNCGSCTNCLSACPTNAFDSPYNLNAKKCISYLTIEKKGVFNELEAKSLGEWIFGCDICQEVCPFNYKTLKEAKLSDEEFIGKASNNGLVSLEEILNIKSDQEFLEKYKGTPFMRAKREGLFRNSMSVIINTKSEKLYKKIEEIAKFDLNIIIKEQAGEFLKFI